MQIGTAVPSKDELKQAKHHFIQHISVKDQYSVGAFEKDALRKLEELFKIHDIVIMVGGSGLYIDAVTKGLDDFPDIDPSIRQSLNSKFKSEGLESLHSQLKKLDITSYESIAIDNPHRVIRALEICIGTGQPYSSFLNKKKGDRHFKTLTIGLTADRTVIYNRINMRVDMMIKEGLVHEAKALYHLKQLNALNTVGYKEIFKYFDGEWSLEFAISEIKKNTRRFAKRQLTWFKKQDHILWFDYEEVFDNVINNELFRLTLNQIK